MADIRRPHTVLGNYSPVDYVDTDVQIAGDYVLAPGFRKTLEEYYPKASGADRDRCLELLTSLEISDVIKKSAQDYNPDPALSYPCQPPPYVPAEKPRYRRPKSAMNYPPASSARIGRLPETRNPYTTTYDRDYPLKKAEETYGVAPRTLGGKAYTASHELSDPVGDTQYQTEYFGSKKLKDCLSNPQLPIRAGTASGFRRNNPHPFDTFMIWKWPKEFKRDGERGSCPEELTDEMLDKSVRGLMSTTYQGDYLGVPQGYPLDKLFNIQSYDWKSTVPYTLNSESRRKYQKPVQQPELKHTYGRYTANKDKSKNAVGIAPTVPKKHMLDLKTRTLYECEYTDPIGPRPAQVRNIGELHANESIQRHLNQQKPWTSEKKWKCPLSPPKTPRSTAKSSCLQNTRPCTSRGMKEGRPAAGCATDSSGNKFPLSSVRSPPARLRPMVPPDTTQLMATKIKQDNLDILTSQIMAC